VTRTEIAHIIDHTLLRANATQDEIALLCAQAAEHGFAGVSINPAWVRYCAGQLAGAGVAVNPTIGFPLGANTAHVKVEEVRDAIHNGATELDMVINVGALCSGLHQYVEREIAAIVTAAGGLPVKVILETGYLTDAQKRAVCEMAERSGAAFVKTSTGFGKAGATVEDIALMRETVGDRLGVKAAGGIRTYGQAMAMVSAGATRIGSSASLDILADAH